MLRYFVCSVGLLAMLSLVGCDVSSEPAVDVASGGSAGDQALGDPAEQSQSTGQLAKGELNFVAGYQHGYDVAAREGKPMLLFFTAEWCHFCHQMADEAFTHQQVVNLSQQFVCVLVDADREPEVCRQFKVQNYPTVQFLSSRGVQLNRMIGKKPGHQLMMAMQAALQNIARRESNAWR